MSGAVDKILTGGLQDFEQYHKLNPIDIKINDIKIILSLSKHGKHRLKITSLLFGASFSQTTDIIFITCNRLNGAKKSLINGKIHNILGVVNLTEETNFDLIKTVQSGLILCLMKVIEKQNILVLR